MRWQIKTWHTESVEKRTFLQNSFWISHGLPHLLKAPTCEEEHKLTMKTCVHTECHNTSAFWTGQIRPLHDHKPPCTEIPRAYLHARTLIYIFVKKYYNTFQSLTCCDSVICPGKLGTRKPLETIWEPLLPSILQNPSSVRYEDAFAFESRSCIFDHEILKDKKKTKQNSVNFKGKKKTAQLAISRLVGNNFCFWKKTALLSICSITDTVFFGPQESCLVTIATDTGKAFHF